MTPVASEPVLSICIVNWNTRRLLADCLGSIYADPASSAWEVIVVDNGSTDGSVAMVAERFPQARRLVSPQNLGFAGGNNLALTSARGQYLLLLNSDTWVQSGALATLVEFMESHPEAGAVGPRLVDQDGGLQLSCGRPLGLASVLFNKLLLHKLFPFFKFGRWNHAQIREVGWVTGACLLIRRETVNQVGLLDSAIFMFYEDLEWCLRIRKAGWKIFYCPFSQITHLGGQSTRQDFQTMLVISQQSLFYLFEKHFSQVDLHLLRLLTVAEMLLRTCGWTARTLLHVECRREGRQRLGAYRQILLKTLVERSYWAPLETRASKFT